MSDLEKINPTLEPEELVLPCTGMEAILSIFNKTIAVIDKAVDALGGDLYIEGQATALKSTVADAVLLATEAITALVEINDAYEEGLEDGYEEGAEDGYAEAVDDLTENGYDFDDEEGALTQLFYCGDCDHITDLVLLSAETGDKLCPDCGGVMEPYNMDHEDEPTGE